MNQTRAVLSPGDTASSRDQSEIDGFSALADQWWDTAGPFAPLHRLNPARIRAIADICAKHFSTPLDIARPFNSLSLWDVGCGGGLVAEPLARMGFKVTGMDASEENVVAAQRHAKTSNLEITYVTGAPEELPSNDQQYDVVLALEVVEHVSDIDTFVGGLARQLRPGGLLIFSTIHRSLRSMALAKVAAEYILRWVPAGTHTWSKFVKPSELAKSARSSGLKAIDIRGLEYQLSTGEWTVGKDVSVNYILAATPS